MKKSGAPLLAFLLFVGAIVAAIALSGGGAGLARWLANGGLGYLLAFAIVMAGFVGALWLLGKVFGGRRR